jgi:prolyl 4-hydroxylase
MPAVEPRSRPDSNETGRRLAKRAGVQRFPDPRLDLFVVKSFLDEESCAALIERIDARRRPSTIADDIGIADFRTSETCDLDSADPLVGEVDRMLCELLGIPPSSASRSRGSATMSARSSRPIPTRSIQAAMIFTSTPPMAASGPGRRWSI